MDLKLTVETSEPVNRQIEKFLRQQINQAQGDASFRLPATKELAKKWGVSCTAIDQAMAPLVAEGLLERRRKRGTFIRGGAQQTVIGIVFGSSLSDEMAHFHRALRSCLAAEIAGLEGCNWTTRVYDGLYGLLAGPSFEASPACRNLSGDVSNYCFKGIILISREPELLKMLKPAFDLPLACLGPLPERNPDVIMDLAGFGRDSIGYLAGKGIRRIAYLRTFAPNVTSRADLDAMSLALKAHPTIELKTHDILGQACLADRSSVEGTASESTASLIDGWNRAGWPDAIVVSDDIAMRGVALALIRRHDSVPERLEVMTLANEGICHHYGIPVTRYEFSPRLVAKNLVDILRRRIVGEALPPLPVRLEGRLEEPASAMSISHAEPACNAHMI